jgi:broad specificity phosphatase PhoE
MPATRIHLVRHGEVHNPDGVLYGRLPNFSLSELGEQMALAAAEELKASGAKVTRLISSPLQRTLQSSKPIAEVFGVPVETEERIIEPTNIFEGHSVNFKTLVRNPRFLLKLYSPTKPSWGEPFLAISKRMLEAMSDAWATTKSGEVVMVSHQLPIWMVHRTTEGQRLSHDPRQRRCDLSSITSFDLTSEGFMEVDYKDPAKKLRIKAVDKGAV